MPRDSDPRERQARVGVQKRHAPALDRIVFVTEGAKTAPRYLEDIRKQKRISSARI